MKHRNDSQWTWGAFHSTENQGLNFRRFSVSNGTVFSTRRTDLVLFPLGHISREDLFHKMLKDYDEVKCRRLIRAKKFNTLSRLFQANSTLILLDCLKHHFHAMRETCNFSVTWKIINVKSDQKIMLTIRLPTGNSERPLHNFTVHQILTFVWKVSYHEQARTAQIVVHPMQCRPTAIFQLWSTHNS